MVYGLAECVRLLQEVNRPVVLVCAESFSDKIGSVRPSRMIFADGAAALVIGPAPSGAAATSSLYRPTQWPVQRGQLDHLAESEFDNSLRFTGRRCSRWCAATDADEQELSEARAPEDPRARSWIRSTWWCRTRQPHHGHEAGGRRGAGTAAAVFHIHKVGNTSAASIPIAVSDAVAEG